MKRKIHDITFLVFLAVVLLTQLGIIIFATVNQKLKTLIIPINSKGEVCGVERNVDKPNLLIIDYLSIQPVKSIYGLLTSKTLVLTATTICVKTCPTYTGVPSTTQHNCVEDIKITSPISLTNAISQGSCSRYNIPTQPLHNYCVPDFGKFYSNLQKIVPKELSDSSKGIGSLTELVDTFTSFNKLSQIFKDYSQVKWWLVLCLFVGFACSLLLIVLIGFGSYPILIILYLVTLVVCLSSTIVFSFWYKQMDNMVTQNEIVQSLKLKVESISKTNSSNIFLGCAITSGILSFIIIVSGCFLAGAVRIACFCISKSANTTISLFTTIIFPLASSGIQAFMVVLWGYIILCLFSSSEKSYRFLDFSDGSIKLGGPCELGANTKATTKCIFAGAYTSNLKWILIVIYTFNSIFFMFFTSGVTMSIVSYIYYRSYCKSNNIKLLNFVIVPIRGFVVIMCFNLGSICFGALLMTLLTVLIIVFEVVTRITGINEDGKLKYFVKPVRRILIFFYDIAKFINNNVMLAIGVTGKCYWDSAKLIFKTFAQFPLATLSIQVFNFFAMFFGVVLGILITGFTSYLILDRAFPKLETTLHFSILTSIFSLFLIVPLYLVFTKGAMSIHFCNAWFCFSPDHGKDVSLVLSDDVRELYEMD